jgi:ABC-type ATPase with predicted acetyltransferase domain
MKVKRIKVIDDRENFKNKWLGLINVCIEDGTFLTLPCAGIVSQWLTKGTEVELEIEDSNSPTFSNYRLWRLYRGEKIKVWPVFEEYKNITISDPVRNKKLYEYKLRIREATRKRDFEHILELEQYHYASKKEVLGIWKCTKCGSYLLANLRPICDRCGSDEDVVVFQIKGSLPTSRFLILELASHRTYEPEVLGYVRVDTPVPKMNRRLPDGSIIKNIREQVFPEDWFSPLFYFAETKSEYFDYVRKKAVQYTDTAVSRISRVVIHPDYRADGLGKLAVSYAVKWIRERRIPEMKRKKELVEVIAQMARFNPFFEKAGFKYLWDTGSGRPVLYYPLTEMAEGFIQSFIKNDKYALAHKGRLYTPSFEKNPPLSGSIVFKNVTKYFENSLNIESLNLDLKNLLESFGVAERKIQRRVISKLDLTIKPGTVLLLIGASGAGKTTLLRLIVGKALKLKEDKFMPTEGDIYVPEDVKISVFIPGEFEPVFKDESIIEHIYNKTKNEIRAVEILNRCGLSDAVLYRARFFELSTGQKERAKIASLLADSPNLIIIDELASHLDSLTAMRMCRRLVSLIREMQITFIASTHRMELIDSISPDRILYVGYGRVTEYANF